MKQLKLVVPIVVSGHPGLKVGELFELPDREAEDLICQKWAVPVDGVYPKQDGFVAHRDPVPETRDPETQPPTPSARKNPKSKT